MSKGTECIQTLFLHQETHNFPCGNKVWHVHHYSRYEIAQWVAPKSTNTEVPGAIPSYDLSFLFFSLCGNWPCPIKKMMGHNLKGGPKFWIDFNKREKLLLKQKSLSWLDLNQNAVLTVVRERCIRCREICVETRTFFSVSMGKWRFNLWKKKLKAVKSIEGMVINKIVLIQPRRLKAKERAMLISVDLAVCQDNEKSQQISFLAKKMHQSTKIW